MKKAVAMKWVEALRSGKYIQGTECLLKDTAGRYCCLGVLCEIENLQPSRENSVIANHEKVGMRDSIGSLGDFDSSTNLAFLNDGHYLICQGERFTFDEIADIIQICWKDL